MSNKNINNQNLSPEEKRRQNFLCPPDVSSILAIKRQKIIDTMDTHGINEPISLEEAKAWMRYPDTMPSWLMSAKLDDDLEKLNNNEKKRQRVEERRGEGRQRET